MKPTLLIVDDEPAGRESLESVLINQDYTLVFAANGQEALDQARSISPDVILLDVMMPGMDGFDVCRQLRADPQMAEVPVIIVTALDDRESRLEGIDAGADDFINKPIDRVELRARVRTITRLNRYRRLKEERRELERQLDRVTALRLIDQAISSSVDLGSTLGILLQKVISELNVDAAAILTFHPRSLNLQYFASRGFKGHEIEQTRIRLGEGLAGRAALDREMVCFYGPVENPGVVTRPQLWIEEKVQTYMAVPLLAKGKLEGVLEVFLRERVEPDLDWLDFLKTLGNQAAIAIDNFQLFEDLQRSNSNMIMAYDATLEGWSRAMDLRDKDTEGHSLRVTEMTLRLGTAMGMGENELVHIRRGALLHDIGKLGIPDEILQKKGPLTDAEWVEMRKHPTLAMEMLSPINYLRPALDIPLYHHEKWDGSGYPYQLKGEQIPLAARMFALADVWDALTSDRPYRRAWLQEKAKDYLRSQMGKHFDPQAAEIFLHLLESGGLE